MVQRIKRRVALRKAEPTDEGGLHPNQAGEGMQDTPHKVRIHLYYALDPSGRAQVDASLQRRSQPDGDNDVDDQSQRRMSKSTKLRQWLIKAKRGDRIPGSKYIARIPMGTNPDGSAKYKYIYSYAQMLKHTHPDNIKEGSVIDSKGEGGGGHHVEVHKVTKDGQVEVTHHATGHRETTTVGKLHQDLKNSLRERTKEYVAKKQAVYEEAQQYGSEKQISRAKDEFERVLADAKAMYEDMFQNIFTEPEGEQEEYTPIVGAEAETLHLDVLPEFPHEKMPGRDILEFTDLAGNPSGSAYRHQAEGVARILSSWDERDGFVLMDTAGLGKTVTALLATKAYGGDRNLIVVPTFGKENVKQHWVGDGDTVGIDIKTTMSDEPGHYVVAYNELYDTKLRFDPYTENPGLSDDQLGELARITGDKKVYARTAAIQRMIPGISEEDAAATALGLVDYAEVRPEFSNFDTIVFDESHNMANPASLQSQAGVQLQLQELNKDGGSKVLYMSATPFTTLRDCHYLRGLNWFRTGEDFATWAENAGATLARKTSPVGDIPFSINNPDTPIPAAMVSAKMHADGAGIRREPLLGTGDSKLNSVFSRHSVVRPEHEAMFKAGDKVEQLAAEAGVNPLQLGGMMTLWKKQAWELVKADDAIAHAKKELDDGRQVLVFTEFTRHDHAALGGQAPTDGSYGCGLAASLRKSAADMLSGVGGKIEKLGPAQRQEYDLITGNADKIDDIVRGMHTENIMDRMASELARHVGGDAAADNWHEHVAQIHGKAKDAEGNLIGRGRDDATVADLAAYQGTADTKPTKRVAIASMAKGGTGLSYHDKYGHAPRSQINLSIPWAAVGFDQVSGRSHRLGSKSDTNMVWMHGDDDKEKNTASVLAKKLASMGSLMKGDPGGKVTAAMLGNFESVGTVTSPERQAEIIDILSSGQLPEDMHPESARVIQGIMDQAQAVKSFFSLAVDDMRAGGNPLASIGSMIRENAEKAFTEDEERRVAAGQMVAQYGVRISQDPNSPMRFRVVPGRLPAEAVEAMAQMQGVRRYPDGSLSVAEPSVFKNIAESINANTHEFSRKKLGKDEKLFSNVYGKPFAIPSWDSAALEEHYDTWTSSAPEGGHHTHTSKVDETYGKVRSEMVKQRKAKIKEARDKEAQAAEKLGSTTYEKLRAKQERAEKSWVVKAADAGRVPTKQKRTPAGWEPIPHGTKGGLRRMTSNGRFEYWYPGAAKAPAAPPGKSPGHQVVLSASRLDDDIANGNFTIIATTDEDRAPVVSAISSLGMHYSSVDADYNERKASVIVPHNTAPKNNSAVMVHHDGSDGSHEHTKLRAMAKSRGIPAVIHSRKGYHEMHFLSGEHDGEYIAGKGAQYRPVGKDYYSDAPHAVDDDRTTTRFDLNFKWGDYKKAGGSEVSKGRRAIPGEVRRWKQGRFRKMPDGTWVPADPHTAAKEKEVKPKMRPAAASVPKRQLKVAPVPTKKKRTAAAKPGSLLPSKVPTVRASTGIPRALLGKTVGYDDIVKHGGLKAVFGGVGISKYPALDGAAAVDTGTIKCDLTGDINKHAVLTWRDAKGRMQSAYTMPFIRKQAAIKWDRVIKFSPMVPGIRDAVEKLLHDGSKSVEERDAAAIISIIAVTGLRPGSEQSVRDHGHYGVSTLREEHVRVKGTSVTLEFVGKSGKVNTAVVADNYLSAYIEARKQTAGQRGGAIFDAGDSTIRSVSKSVGMGRFKLKDFRTALATRLAAEHLASSSPPPPMPEDPDAALKLVKRRVLEASKVVAAALNNTPAVARSSYIAPPIIAAWARSTGAPADAVDALYKAAADISADELGGDDEEDVGPDPFGDESAPDPNEPSPKALAILDDAFSERISYAYDDDSAELIDDDEDDQLDAYPLPAVLAGGDEYAPEDDDDDGPVEAMEKALTRWSCLFKGMVPAGAGWQPIPGGKHGGFRRRNGASWEYWYPSADHARRAADHHAEQGEKMRKKLGRILRSRGAKQEDIERFLDHYDHHTRMSEAGTHHASAAERHAQAFTYTHSEDDSINQRPGDRPKPQAAARPGAQGDTASKNPAGKADMGATATPPPRGSNVTMVDAPEVEDNQSGRQPGLDDRGGILVTDEDVEAQLKRIEVQLHSKGLDEKTVNSIMKEMRKHVTTAVNIAKKRAEKEAAKKAKEEEKAKKDAERMRAQAMAQAVKEAKEELARGKAKKNPGLNPTPGLKVTKEIQPKTLSGEPPDMRNLGFAPPPNASYEKASAINPRDILREIDAADGVQVKLPVNEVRRKEITAPLKAARARETPVYEKGKKVPLYRLGRPDLQDVGYWAAWVSQRMGMPPKEFEARMATVPMRMSGSTTVEQAVESALSEGRVGEYTELRDKFNKARVAAVSKSIEPKGMRMNMHGKTEG